MIEFAIERLKMVDKSFKDAKKCGSITIQINYYCGGYTGASVEDKETMKPDKSEVRLDEVRR
jgi:hypothetical protein